MHRMKVAMVPPSFADWRLTLSAICWDAANAAGRGTVGRPRGGTAAAACRSTAGRSTAGSLGPGRPLCSSNLDFVYRRSISELVEKAYGLGDGLRLDQDLRIQVRAD